MNSLGAIATAGWILLGFLAAPAAAHAQPEGNPEPTFEEKLQVTEVLLDVVVTDSQGNLILGLGKDDFVVEETGKPVPVESVTFYSNRRFLGSPEEAQRRGIDLGPVPEDRYFIFFVHDQREASMEAPGLLSQQLEAARRAREWVQTEMLPGDFVAVVSWDRKLKIHQDFTHDGKAIVQAISDAAGGKDPGGNWPSRIESTRDHPSLLARMPRGNDLRDQTATIYDGLRVLAEAAGAVRARKNLLLFTTGFGRINSFGQYQPEPQYAAMMQTLNANDVAIYAVELFPPGSEHVMSDAMHQLATETGGHYYFNFVNFLTPLREISKDNNGYYLLAYRSRHPEGKSGFQEVRVRTRNPEFKVKARQGYKFGA